MTVRVRRRGAALMATGVAAVLVLAACSSGSSGGSSASPAASGTNTDPACADYCIFAHRSAEKGHAIAVDAVGAEPLLDLSMRLGEGTGALLALPVARAAAALLSDVASLDDVLSGAL